ncbi:MAG TPA: PRC-barrel domain-containing protein [Anaerolineales bacterium]|nr:PRC-barrel domain-containing protein [Anaerolineales bacterium]
MRLKENARVVATDGQTVGHIDRVVIDPRTKEVTHVVVRKGILFTEDKVLPMNLISRVNEDRVLLREDAGNLDDLPDYEETSYTLLDEYERKQVPAEGYVPPVYWYPLPYAGPGWAAYPVAYAGPQYMARTVENIPEGAVALEEGARVFSADDQHVGDVEQILTDPEADRATHFVISKGIFLKNRKLIPTTWISTLSNNEVHLAVGANLLELLRGYDPQAENKS